MEISSHYYALLALCRTCGINKEISHKIAYASQFVDDAKINCLTGDDGEDNPFESHNLATCHSYFKIRTFNYEAMIANTVSFHFPPGCEGDSFVKKLICTEDNSIVRQIIEEEIKSSPEYFGMLMHIYADTFAHQGFSGLVSKENDIENLDDSGILLFHDGLKSAIIYNWKKFIKKLKKLKIDPDFDDFVPAYGHGQAEHCPDIPYLEWSYEYTHDRCIDDKKPKQYISNIERFKRAFIAIQKYLEMYLRENPEHKDSNFDETKKNTDLSDFFEILKAKEGTKTKIKSWQNYLIQNNYYNKESDKEALTYDETLWIKDVIADFDEKSDLHKQRTVKNVKLVQGYEESSWLMFIAGSISYKSRLIELCKVKGVHLDIEIHK